MLPWSSRICLTRLTESLGLLDYAPEEVVEPCVPVSVTLTLRSWS